MAGAAFAKAFASSIAHAGASRSWFECDPTRAATRASESAAAPAAVTSERGLAAILRWPSSPKIESKKSERNELLCHGLRGFSSEHVRGFQP